MTFYDRIIQMDEETMIEFLYHFARDTIDQFSSFVFPSKDGIREFLERKIPGTVSPEEEE